MKFIKALLFFIVLFSNVGFSDEIRPSYLQIKAMGENTHDVIWKVPARNDQFKLALKVAFDKNVRKIKEPVGAFVGGSYVSNWRIYAPEGLDGTTLQISGLSSSPSDVLLRIINEQGEITIGNIKPDKPTYTFVASAGTWETVKTYTKLGIEHILEGTDHLLFVACLVMIASTFTKLLWTITGFTLAHSITLFLAAMDWVRVPIPPIEAAIALSIVFLAMEIAKNDKNSLTYRYPGLVSSSFGLLHGFGFASALMEIGLPQNERIVALLFFNVGVEIGQLIFVGFLLLMAWFIHLSYKRSKDIQWAKVISYMIGSVSMMWLFQRVLSF